MAWSAYGSNVLVNPGFESGNLTGWSVSGGSWEVNSIGRYGIPATRIKISGAYGLQSTVSNETNYCYQRVTLTNYVSAANIDAGRMRINAGGAVVCGERRYDAARVTVVILNSGLSVIATPVDSGWHTSTTPATYSISDYVIPANGRYVEVRFFMDGEPYEAGTGDDANVQWSEDVVAGGGFQPAWAMPNNQVIS